MQTRGDYMRTQDLDSFSNELKQLMPEMEPFQALFEGAAPVFPSETSARYALRVHRDALMAAGALAMYRGRTCVNRERFLAVVREKARTAYVSRFGGTVAAEPA